jgi:hypothetical protein
MQSFGAFACLPHGLNILKPLRIGLKGSMLEIQLTLFISAPSLLDLGVRPC